MKNEPIYSPEGWAIHVTHYYYDDAHGAPKDGLLVGPDNKVLKFNTEAEARAYLTDTSGPMEGRGPKHCTQASPEHPDVFRYAGVYTLRTGEYSRAHYTVARLTLWATAA